MTEKSIGSSRLAILANQSRHNAPARRKQRLTRGTASASAPEPLTRQKTADHKHKARAAALRHASRKPSPAHELMLPILDASPTAYLLLADDAVIRHANHAACVLLGAKRASLLKREFSYYVEPGSLAALTRHRRAAVRKNIVTELLLRRKDGTSFQVRLWSMPVDTKNGESSGIHTWISELSNHAQTDHALKASEQRCLTLFEQAPLCMFFVEVASGVGVVREANSRAQLVYGYTASEFRGMPLARLAGSDTRPAVQAMVTQAQQGITFTDQTVHRRRDGTLFPVRINATSDPADRHCLIMIVEDTTAEQFRRSETHAIDAERRRMSHEIHDSVAQRLAALCMRSALWRRLADIATPGIDAAIKELQHELNAAIEDIRRAIFAVRPVDLKEIGFFPAVTKWVNGFSLQNKLNIQLSFTGPRERLPSVYELPLFRIIQESFSNILRHAGAKTARINLAIKNAGGVVLTVSDDGKGFDPTKVSPAGRAPHFGLPQMRERLLELSGTLDINSEVGRGTKLVINLPPITRQSQDAVYRGPQRRVASRRQKDRA